MSAKQPMPAARYAGALVKKSPTRCVQRGNVGGLPRACAGSRYGGCKSGLVVGRTGHYDAYEAGLTAVADAQSTPPWPWLWVGVVCAIHRTSTIAVTDTGMTTVGDWTEKEIQRFIRREAVFAKEGFKFSERLAEQMLNRDRDPQDNRRVCFECKHLRGRSCAAQSIPPMRFILQRCDDFVLKGVA